MSEDQSSIIPILEKAMEDAGKDRNRLLEELKKVRDNRHKLEKIIYTKYEKPTDKIPVEFSDPEKFITIWHNLDTALGNTILMVMPPSVFEATAPVNVEEKSEQETANKPIIVMPNQKTEPPPARPPARGFFSGVWDYQIEKLKFQQPKTEKPVITTEKITYNPKDVVHQLIPSLNEIKKFYFRALDRFHSSWTPSFHLVKLWHQRLQEELSKYFNVIDPFCYASITFQMEKIRRDKLQQIANYSRIAVAEAQANAFSAGIPQAEIYKAIRAAMGAQDAGAK
jgi:hypothetical protein